MPEPIIFPTDNDQAGIELEIRTDDVGSLNWMMTEGPPGFWYVTDADLVSGGLTMAGTFTYRILNSSGLMVGSGSLRWSGTESMLPAPVDLTVQFASPEVETPVVHYLSVPGTLINEHVAARLNAGDTIASVGTPEVGPVEGGNVTVSGVSVSAVAATIGEESYAIAETIEFNITASARVASSSVDVVFPYTTTAGNILRVVRTYQLAKQISEAA